MGLMTTDVPIEERTTLFKDDLEKPQEVKDMTRRRMRGKDKKRRKVKRSRSLDKTFYLAVKSDALARKKGVVWFYRFETQDEAESALARMMGRNTTKGGVGFVFKAVMKGQRVVKPMDEIINLEG